MQEKRFRVEQFSNGALRLPTDYKPLLSIRATEEAIKFIKDRFQQQLATALNLTRVSAPLVVSWKSGINDHLNGVERPITFTVRDFQERAEIVQSLAKWKRYALWKYGFRPGEGLYTDMNALRPDEYLDNLHSIYVDQWDWELVIEEQDRNVEFLQKVVKRIYEVIKTVEGLVCERYPLLGKPFLPEQISFVHAWRLQEEYPELSPEEREAKVCQEKGAVFIIGIGAELQDGKPHDGRAADYDDWITPGIENLPGLNGDIIVHYPLLGIPFELSSMGIRVDRVSLLEQLRLKGEEWKINLPYHQLLQQGKLPLTIGGGIGQSRLCMFYLRKAHIGEVQASIWPDEIVNTCSQVGIPLL